MTPNLQIEYRPIDALLPSVEGYGLTPQEAVLRTDMESGPARQRRRFRQTPTRITVRWLFSEFEFALFEAWYKYHADGHIRRDPKTDLLTLNDELVISLVLARCQTTPTGHLRWRIRFDPARLFDTSHPDITVAIRLDPANT